MPSLILKKSDTNMNTHHQFKIINSTYKGAEAQEVLLSLLNDKIRFLEHQIFGREVRFGEDMEHLKRRVKELCAAKLEVREVIERAKVSGDLLEISCDVHIQLKKSATLPQH